MWFTTYEEIRIPVIGETSEAFAISASKNEVQVNEAVTFTVTPAEGTNISEIQLCDGENFYDMEENTDDGTFTTDIAFGRAGRYSVFAKAKMEGNSDWTLCEPVVINTSSHGQLALSMPEGVPNTICDEKDLAFTVAKPENADSYGVSVWYGDAKRPDYEDEDWPFLLCEDWTTEDSLEVSIDAAKLEEGMNLHVMIKGWGYGYEYNEVVTTVGVLAHEWGETSYVWAKDYSTVTATRVCTSDASHSETETVGTTSKIVESTCTAQGNTRYTSNDFKNKAFTVQTKDVAISKKDHPSYATKKENEIAATCTDAGSYDEVVYCTKCNAEISRTKKTTSALGHSWGEWRTTVAPTELAAGKKVRTCARGHVEEATVAQLKPTLAVVKIAKPEAGNKSMTVKWKAVAKKNLKKTKKIQIQYSLDKKFSKGVKTKYASAKKTSLVVKGLKSKKKYYVRVRAYTKSGKTVHVSKWSATKAIKVN